MEKSPEIPQESIDKIALGTMHLRDHDEIVAYRTDGGIDVLRLIETGEVTLRSVQVGGKLISFEVKVREPLIDTSYSSWRDYAIAVNADISNENQDKPSFYRGNAEHDTQFDNVRDVILAVAAESASSIEKRDRTMPCHMDCDDGLRTSECWCVSLRDSYTNIAGETVREPRELGEPDPDCNECDGSGQRTLSCYYCLGNGIEIVNPEISIINHSTGETTTFRLEIAELIASGDTELMIQNERQYGPKKDSNNGRLDATIDIEDFIYRKALEVGIDIKNDEITTYWGTEPLETFGTTLGHFQQRISTAIGNPSDFNSAEDFGHAALDALQQSAFARIRTDIYGVDRQTDPAEAVREQGKIFDIDFNDDLTVSRVGLRIDKAPPAHEILQKIISILDERNLRLGFSITGIATGETGPALYILDSNGNVLEGIAEGYTEQTVLEQAYLHVSSL